MESLDREKGSRRKAIRYLRWGVKLAFLIVFVGPILFFTDSTCFPPVYSLVYGGFTPSSPLFTVPYGESVCSFILFEWLDIGPGKWIVCPFGGFQVYATAANPPAAGLPISWLLTALLSAILIFIFLIFIFGAMFCSWVCPVGTVVDSFDNAVQRFMPKLNKRRAERLRQSRKKEEQRKQNREKRGSLCPTCFLGRILNSKHATVANGVIVSALVGTAIFRFPVFCAVCPIGVLARGMFHLKSWTYMLNQGLNRTLLQLKPAAHILDEGLLNLKNTLGVIDMPVIVEFVLIIPLVAVLLSLKEKRYWCRKICPVGAIVRFFAKLNPFIKPIRNLDKCVCPADHEACKNACPQDIGPQEKGSAQCTKCLECYVRCKQDNVKIKWVETPNAFLKLKRFFKTKMDKIKTVVLVLLFACIILSASLISQLLSYQALEKKKDKEYSELYFQLLNEVRIAYEYYENWTRWKKAEVNQTEIYPEDQRDFIDQHSELIESILNGYDPRKLDTVIMHACIKTDLNISLPDVVHTCQQLRDGFAPYEVLILPEVNGNLNWTETLQWISTDFGGVPICLSVFEGGKDKLPDPNVKLGIEEIEEAMAVSDVRMVRFAELISWYMEANETRPNATSFDEVRNEVRNVLEFCKSQNVKVLWSEWKISYDVLPLLKSFIDGYEDVVTMLYQTNNKFDAVFVGYLYATQFKHWGESVQSWYWEDRELEGDMPEDLIADHTILARNMGAEVIQFEPYWYFFDNGEPQEPMYAIWSAI